MVGFARNTILSVADKVVDAVKTKKLRHIFLVGGCDGAKPGRNYYTELVEKAPDGHNCSYFGVWKIQVLRQRPWNARVTCQDFLMLDNATMLILRSKWLLLLLKCLA